MLTAVYLHVSFVLCWSVTEFIRALVPPTESGVNHAIPFDVGQIDDVIHGRFRLGIMAHLARKSDVAEFNKLKDLPQATQGNLSVHLRKLEDAGYVAIEKRFLIRKPVTRVHLTSAGRKAFGMYLDAIGRLVS